MTKPKTKCDDCKHFAKCSLVTVVMSQGNCQFFETIMTNRDLINAMSDEELAKWKCQNPGHHNKNGHCRIYWLDARPCHPMLPCGLRITLSATVAK